MLLELAFRLVLSFRFLNGKEDFIIGFLKWDTILLKPSKHASKPFKTKYLQKAFLRSTTLSKDENKTVDRSILRPILRPSEFAKAALQVVRLRLSNTALRIFFLFQNRQIQQCKEFMESHRNKLTIPGLTTNFSHDNDWFKEVATIKERDAIETEIVTFIKTCSASVENLSKTIVSLKERPVQMTQLNPQAIAYRHGMVCSF